jgi:hypothetical protein
MRPAAPAPVKQPEKPAIPDTEAGLMEAIVACCDQLDIGMKAVQQAPEINFRYPNRESDERSKWLVDLRTRMVELTGALGQLVPEDGRDFDGDIEGLVNTALREEAGVVPRWSRPGTFLIWAGFVPVRCIWGGFAFPRAEVTAANPAMPWIGAGYIDSTVRPDDTTPDHVFRRNLLEDMEATTWRKGMRVPTFQLTPLNGYAKRLAAEYLEANAWLRAALAKGQPRDALPLPKHVQGIQLALT